MANLSETLSNGIKMVTEFTVIPGTSLLLDGRIVGGVAHAGGAVLTRALLGGTWVGSLLTLGIILNSYSASATETNGLFGQSKVAQKALDLPEGTPAPAAE